MALEVSRRRIGAGDHAVEIIDVVGRLDAPGGALLRSSVQEALKEGSPRIALNLSECIEIHREMVGTIHSLGRACKRAGGDLVVFGAAGDVLEYIKAFADPALAQWHESERDAIIALGGEVEPEDTDDGEDEPAVIVALGTDIIFRKVFWKLSKLGGQPVAKFDSITAATDYISRRKIHSIIIDTILPAHDVVRLVRHIRATRKIREMGIFIVGAPSSRKIGRAFVEEGADRFIPFVFTGEEILSKLDAKTFYRNLKEAYIRFKASHGEDPEKI